MPVIKGTKFSKKTRERMRLAHLGRKHSPETIAKIRAARQERQRLIDEGLLPAFRHSEETKRALSRMAKKAKRKPSPAARAKSVATRKANAVDKRTAKRIMRSH